MIEEVRQWVGGKAQHCRASVLEIGSLNVNGSVRDLFPEPYTGLDMQKGKGVDIVADVLTYDGFTEGQFNTIISTETLEHVTEPWRAVERCAEWLAPGGLLIIAVPFEWPLHDFPSDYYRFTHHGLRFLAERVGLTVLTAELNHHAYMMAQKPERAGKR